MLVATTMHNGYVYSSYLDSYLSSYKLCILYLTYDAPGFFVLVGYRKMVTNNTGESSDSARSI